MTIEIHQPKLEALIRERMASGGFLTVEDLLMQSLTRNSTEEHETATPAFGTHIREGLEIIQDWISSAKQ